MLSKRLSQKELLSMTTKLRKLGKSSKELSTDEEQGYVPALNKKSSLRKKTAMALLLQDDDEEEQSASSHPEPRKRASDARVLPSGKRRRSSENPSESLEEGEEEETPPEGAQADNNQSADEDPDEEDTLAGCDTNLAVESENVDDDDAYMAVDAANSLPAQLSSTEEVYKRIPRKNRRDLSSDDDEATNPLSHRHASRVIHTISTTPPPATLDYVKENGKQVLTNTVVKTFFSALDAWRNDSSHHGAPGTAQRNKIFISAQVRAWLDNMSSDPDTNKTGRKWGDFTDSELQEHILRWNGERACGPSTTVNVLQAINNMFQYRLEGWMTRTPNENHTEISNCRAAVMEGLAATLPQWSAASSEQKKSWVLRLLQILLDPRVKQPALGTTLPRMDAQSIPHQFADSAQMAIALLTYEIIKGLHANEDIGDFWERFQLKRWHPSNDEGLITIDDPEKLFDFLSKLCRSCNAVAANMARVKVKYEALFPPTAIDSVGQVNSRPDHNAHNHNNKSYGKHSASGKGNKNGSTNSNSSNNHPRGNSNNPRNGNQQSAGQKNAATAAHSGTSAAGGHSASPSTHSRECYICGRDNHGAKDCRFSEHAYGNRNASVRWIDSVYGKLYRERDSSITVLPPNVDPTGLHYKLPSDGNNNINRGRKGMSYVTALIHDLQNCNVNSTILFSNSRLQAQALIDSGANSSDYISTRVYNWLKDLGMVMTPPSQPFVNGAWIDSSCSIIGSVENLSVNLITDSSKTMTLDLTNVKVIDGNFDIILGLPTIRKYDLTVNLRSLFAPESKKNSRTKQSVVEHLTVLHNLPNWLAALSAVEQRPQFSSNKQTSKKYTEKHYIEYAKEDLLELVFDDDEEPEWKPEISDILPHQGEKLDDESPLPVIHGDGPFQKRVRKILNANRDTFARTIGPQPAVIDPMVLELEEGTPFRQGGPPRPQSLAKQQALIEQLDNMLRLGVIKRSQASDYSQVVMVAKPHQPGKWRFCVDYRTLNEKLKSMGWPIPNIDRLFARLGSKKAKYFAVLDLTSGYHQVLLDQKTRHLAAFVTDYGVFEPVRLWMGIKSAPSYFQKQMARVLHGLLYDICEIYIDDIIIYGQTEEEFASNLDKVLKRLKEHNLTLNPDKAKIGLTELEYVGRVINEHGVTMSDEKIRKVVEFPLPKTPRQLKQFLGLVNYFRAHIRDFALIAAPLHTMTEGYNVASIRSKPLRWTQEAIDAFELLKDAIRANPLLHFLDEQLPVSLATDASDYGIGAYLYQTKPGEDGKEVEIPIAFLSQSMTKVQRRWSTIEKECYAIWYAVKKWEHLLRDIPFIIYTDHRNLKYLNTNTPKVVRWKLAIQEFDFTVRHIEGEANFVADTFSRLCAQDGEEDEVAFDGKSPRTLACGEDEFPDRLCSLTDVCSCAPVTESTAFLCGIVASGPLGNVTPKAPPFKLRPRSRRVGQGKRKKRNHPMTSETASKIHLMDVDHQQENDQGHNVDNDDDKNQSLSQPVVNVQNLYNIVIAPEHVQYLQEVHNEYEGHMGFHLTMKRLKDKSRSWPLMRRDVRKFISECPTCQALRRLAPAIKALPYVTGAPAPMERISIDTMGPYKKSARGYEYTLVVIDNFSRFVELYPLQSVDANEAAERILEFVSRYGQPQQILSDGGTQFLNDTVKELCKLLQVSTIVATPYSKEENGIVERANKEVLRHLRAFLADSKILEAWSSYLPLIQRIMNSTPHKATGVSPAAILFGDATRLDRRVLQDLPNENYDATTGEPLPPNDNMSPNLRSWIDRMLAAQHRIIQIAKQNQESEQQRHTRHNSPDETPVIFQPNEYVMCEYPDTAFGKRPPNKLLTPLRGPFRVVAYNPSRRQYELQHLNINKTFKIDPSKVHKFNYDPARTDPAEVALRDKQEFYVQAIHGVKGNPKRRSTLTFLVEWEGYDEGTWEPWSHLRHNTILHEYLRNHPTRDLRKLATRRQDEVNNA